LGEHADNYLKVELHARIAEKLPLRITDVTDSVYPRTPHPGLNAYPSNAALMIHLLIHAAGAMASRSLRLLHLHDIALVSSRMAGSDWDELVKHGQEYEQAVVGAAAPATDRPVLSRCRPDRCARGARQSLPVDFASGRAASPPVGRIAVLPLGRSFSRYCLVSV
jgi:hypothetical protein